MTLAQSPVPDEVDLLVVGGGINGAGIARDAAGRGLSVLLVEQDDLAAHTSSASSKLIHGGLRYLEHGEFALVRKALAEREVLLRAAPHLVRLQGFVLPLVPGMRPAWMIRAGLFLYDHLSRRVRVPGSSTIELRSHAVGEVLRPEFTRGFGYADAWTDDARLVVTNAMDCAERGGTVLTRTRCLSARREGERWSVRLAHAPGGERIVRARALVNATGPWAARFLAGELSGRGTRSLRLVRGSHIVVPALFAHEQGYVLQQPDHRIVFALPYEGRYTLIGTTDVEHAGDPGEVVASDDEIDYLCRAVNRVFVPQITPADVAWSFSGVRPLLEDEAAAASSVTRDYALDLDASAPPLLNVFGGKLTTYRTLAEEAVDRLAPLLGCYQSTWTRNATLPGGDIPNADFAGYAQEAQRRYAWLPAELLARWLRSYGTRIDRVIGGAKTMSALGEEIVPGLYAVELAYLIKEEWARSGDDVLWRRTKLGLPLSAPMRAAAAARIDQWLEKFS